MIVNALKWPCADITDWWGKQNISLHMVLNGSHFFAYYIFKSILMNKYISIKFLMCEIAKIVISSGNGLAPVRCQAIYWTNDDQGFWHQITLLGHVELILGEHDRSVTEAANRSVLTLHLNFDFEVSGQHHLTYWQSCRSWNLKNLTSLPALSHNQKSLNKM